MKKIQIISICLILLIPLLACGSSRHKFVSSSPTPILSEEEIASWKKFENESVEIWLPANFEHLRVDQEQAQDMLDLFSKKEPSAADIVNPEVIEYLKNDESRLALIDSGQLDSNFAATVIVVLDDLNLVPNVEFYMKAVARELPEQWQVVSQEKIPLGRDQVGKMILEVELKNWTLKQIIYVIQPGPRTVWVVVYTTTVDDYDQRLSIFEKSIQTFRIKP